MEQVKDAEAKVKVLHEIHLVAVKSASFASRLAMVIAAMQTVATATTMYRLDLGSPAITAAAATAVTAALLVIGRTPTTKLLFGAVVREELETSIRDFATQSKRWLCTRRCCWFFELNALLNMVGGIRILSLFLKSS